MTTKDKILEALQGRPNEYVSGSQIASHLNISRNAIWKAIEQLRADGYVIEAVTHKGYKLTALSDKLVPSIIARYLKKFGVPKSDLAPVYFFNKADSTNRKAKEYISKGTPHGTTVIARIVTSGLSSEEGPDPDAGNLNMSVIVNPERYNAVNSLQLIHLSIVAVYESLKDLLGIECEIKDVDNLYYRGQKMCELYTETAGEMKAGVRKLNVSILGICITPKGFPVNRSLLAAMIIKHIVYEKTDINIVDNVYDLLCKGHAV